MNTIAISDLEARVERLVGWYGDGSDGASPTREQWRCLAGRPADRPVSLVNFFKLRDGADYPADAAERGDGLTGQQAFDRYAAVSMPTLAKVGGRFLLVAPFAGAFVGEPDDWDLVAIGSYPGPEAVLALFEDAGYRAVFGHRTAACVRQKVVLCDG